MGRKPAGEKLRFSLLGRFLRDDLWVGLRRYIAPIVAGACKQAYAPTTTATT